MTKARCNVGEYAHIIADSPGGTRGVPGESERLADDPSNLMLACFDCHDRIDRHGKSNEFTAEQLHAMKRDHESRIEHIYSATGVTESLPVLMAFPVGSHVPVIDIRNIRYAMLTNSDFSSYPTANHVYIDRSNFDVQDNEPDFWPRAQKTLTEHYERLILPELTARSGAAHLTIAGFAPIPLLMKFGALIGDKTRATILDLPGDGWLWDKRADCPTPTFTYSVPDTLPHEVAAVISISNKAVHPVGREVVEFQATVPDRGIIRKPSHLASFRQEFDAFLQRITRAGARVMHVYPATPLAASVEIGRMLLPKTFEAIHVWEWQAPDWKQCMQLK